MKGSPRRADCSTAAREIQFCSGGDMCHRSWYGEAEDASIFQKFKGIKTRDAPVSPMLTSLLGLSLQKIQLQVWEGLLSPEEVPLPVLLPWGETEAEPFQVLVWRQKAKAL